MQHASQTRRSMHMRRTNRHGGMYGTALQHVCSWHGNIHRGGMQHACSICACNVHATCNACDIHATYIEESAMQHGCNMRRCTEAAVQHRRQHNSNIPLQPSHAAATLLPASAFAISNAASCDFRNLSTSFRSSALADAAAASLAATYMQRTCNTHATCTIHATHMQHFR